MIMDITIKFRLEKENTLQYYLSELLRTNLSDYTSDSLQELNNNDIEKFLTLFPIRNRAQIPEIKKSLKAIKASLPEDLYEDVEDEVKEICEDYTWSHSKQGKLILQIEEWIKMARCKLATDFPNEMVYIGRSFIEPVSLIIGGYVKDPDLLKTYFNNLNPPINIEYKISVLP